MSKLISTPDVTDLRSSRGSTFNPNPIQGRRALVSSDNRWTEGVIERLVNPSLASLSLTAPTLSPPESTRHDSLELEKQLYQLLAQAKVSTAQISMHFKPEWRKRIFQQLDYLLSKENWDDASVLLSLSSFSSFLRTVVQYRDLPPPFLTLSSSGNIWASWRAERIELSCEFLAKDRVRFLMKQLIDGQKESLAWDGPTARLRDRLRQFDNVEWFPNGTQGTR